MISLPFIDAGIPLLIRLNVPELIQPLEVSSENFGEPFATRHRLSWAVTQFHIAVC